MSDENNSGREYESIVIFELKRLLSEDIKVLLLRAVNDVGNFISGVYGWVDAQTVSAVNTSSTDNKQTAKTPI